MNNHRKNLKIFLKAIATYISQWERENERWRENGE